VFGDIMYSNKNSKIWGDFLFGQQELTPLHKFLPAATAGFGLIRISVLTSNHFQKIIQMGL